MDRERQVKPATPLPWRWEEQFLPEDLGASNGIWVIDADGVPICEAPSQEVAEKIVNSTSLYPELVKVLRECVELLDWHLPNHAGEVEYSHRLEKANGILAKCNGRE